VSFLLIVCVAGLVAVLPITFSTGDGTSGDGELVSITAQTVRLQVDGEARDYPIEQVAAIEFPSANRQTRPALTVTSRGGSKLRASEVVTDGLNLTVTLSDGGAVEIPLRSVASVRFQPPAAGTDATWLGQAEKRARGDVMVIRRSGGTLDAIGGTVKSIGNERVEFDLDGDPISAPINRLEGIVLGGATGFDPPPAPIEVRDVFGSIWRVGSLLGSPDESALTLSTTWGGTHPLAWERVESLRFGGGAKLVTDLQPAAYRSAIAERLDGVDESVWRSLMGPKAYDGDDANAAGAITLRGESTIEFRVPEDAGRLVGAVQRDPKVERGGAMIVRIRTDGSIAWEETIRDKNTLGFEIPVAGVRRFSLELDPTDDGEMGDIAVFLRPRLVK